MEKDQPDSLATVAVVSEKMPQTHSHYAPSEVYSSTEPPPVSFNIWTRGASKRRSGSSESSIIHSLFDQIGTNFFLAEKIGGDHLQKLPIYSERQCL